MCGIFGIIAAENSEIDGLLPLYTVNGLTALQHRGTESSGIVGSDGFTRDHVSIIKGHGLVRDVFDDEKLERLKNCRLLIGHNRYSTAGKKRSEINCVQPFVVYTTSGIIAIAHNGELVDAKSRRSEVMREGVGLSTDTDSELIAQIIAKAAALNSKCENDRDIGDLSRELSATMSAITMSYSLLVMSYDRIYAIRDPFGNRPLCVGTVFGDEKPIGFCAASESCALPVNSKMEFEVRPGEIVEISKSGIKSIWQMKPRTPLSMCIFEYVYFARNDSVIEGQQVESVREETGRKLAEEDDLVADIVGNVPDSSLSAAIGYSSQSKIPYEPCLHRNSYVGRSFIQPSDQMRQNAIVMKFGVLQKKVKNNRIVLVDDSIVRGNTMKNLVKMLRDAGAKEVHLRIASPPVCYPCFMGINIPTKNELIASKHSIEEIRQYIGADSIKYLSVDGLLKAVQRGIEKTLNFSPGHCTACLTGKYPVTIDF